jgi:hypothetical protein
MGDAYNANRILVREDVAEELTPAILRRIQR